RSGSCSQGSEERHLGVGERVEGEFELRQVPGLIRALVDSDDILARMRQVRIAQDAIRSAQGRLNAPMADADRLIRGAGNASVTVSSLVGGAADGTDGRISARLDAAAESGRRFKQRLQD